MELTIEQMAAEIRRHLNETHAPNDWLLIDPEMARFYQQQQPASPPQQRPTSTNVPPQPKPAPKVYKAPPSPPPRPPTQKVQEPPVQPVIKEINREPPAPKTTSTDNFEDLKNLVKQRFPKQSILDSPLTEEAWERSKTHDILILCAEASPAQRDVLIKLTQALCTRICPTKMREVHQEPLVPEDLKAVKLVVAEKSVLDAHATFLGAVATFGLPSIQQMIDEPNSKIALWKELCQSYAGLSRVQ